MRYWSSDQRRSSSMVQLEEGSPPEGFFSVVPMPMMPPMPMPMEDEDVDEVVVVPVEKDSSIIR